ncbi:hypothetical protein O9929_10155 [Vibrio lentus]|nr:hypothetical protein [Vibrio lentus]
MPRTYQAASGVGAKNMRELRFSNGKSDNDSVSSELEATCKFNFDIDKVPGVTRSVLLYSQQTTRCPPLAGSLIPDRCEA